MTRRKNGTWQEAIKLPGMDKPKYFYGKTKAEVNKKIQQFKFEAERGVLIKEVCEEWQDSHFPSIALNTQTSYKPAIHQLESDFSDVPIKDIVPLDVDRAIKMYAEKGYSHQTVKIYLSVLRQVCDYAVLHAYIDVNPCDAVKLPKGLPSNTRDLPSDENIEKIKNSVDLPFGLFAYFLLYTGCRRGEALALQWKDVDLHNKVIHINKSVYFDSSDRPVIKTPKTKAGIRSIILLDILAAKLTPGKPNDFIFGFPDKGTFRRKWETYALESGIAHKEPKKERRKAPNGKYKTINTFKIVNEVTPHQLRHAYATMLFEAGIEVKDAQNLLGHTKESVTRDIYTHIRKSRTENVAQILNEKIAQM